MLPLKLLLALSIMNTKLQGFYVCEWILLTTVAELKINSKQDEDSFHQPTGLK